VADWAQTGQTIPKAPAGPPHRSVAL